MHESRVSPPNAGETGDAIPSGTRRLRIIPLGGLEEIGKNMTVFEYGDDIVVVDAGLKFPDQSMPGIDLVVQDISYLVARRDRVRGYVITHGHEDHTGGLPYALAVVPAPVYATPLTRGLIELKLREHKLLASTTLETVSAGSEIALGTFRVEFFHQCHSIPDAVGVALHSPVGTVVHTGDFKFDQTPIQGRVPDYNALARLGSSGVLVLLSDSTRADTPGYTPSEATLIDAFERVFANANGRILVATFASLISRVQLVFDAAARHDRRLAIVGRSMIQTVHRSLELGYLQAPDGLLARLDEIRGMPLDQLVVLTTGSQGEPSSALTRMALGLQKHVQVVAGDTIVISSTPIPGNEEVVARNIDRLFKLGANVIHAGHAGVHVSGHGAAEELKLMIGLLRPRFLVPIHGHYRHMIMHGRLGVEMGLRSENILIVDNGSVLETDGESLLLAGRVSAGSVLIDGHGRGDVGDTVLHERLALARDGIVVIMIAIDKQTGRPRSRPEVMTRGFVAGTNADALIENARAVVYDALEAQADDRTERSAHVAISEALAKFLFSQTKRRPMIIPMVAEV